MGTDADAAQIGHHLGARMKEGILPYTDAPPLPCFQNGIPQHMNFLPDINRAAISCLIDDNSVCNEGLVSQRQPWMQQNSFRIHIWPRAYSREIKTRHVWRSKK